MEAIREVSILDEGGVRITDKRVILGNETYALENIRSVSMTYSDNQGGMLPILIAVAGSSIGFCALFFSLGEDGLRWGLFLAGGIIAVTAIGLGAMASLGAEPTYYVRVRSSSGEANVLQSKNKAQVARIVQAIDKALVSRVELTSFHSADAQTT